MAAWVCCGGGVAVWWCGAARCAVCAAAAAVQQRRQNHKNTTDLGLHLGLRFNPAGRGLAAVGRRCQQVQWQEAVRAGGDRQRGPGAANEQRAHSSGVAAAGGKGEGRVGLVLARGGGYTH